jgi:hypothetical protein
MSPEVSDPATIVRRTFFFRRARGCTREDAHNMASSIRERAELDSVSANALEELLFDLCTQRKTSVLIEVSA